jgi:hypothetical protein
MSIVTVFLPTGTRAEADEARAALEKTGWKLVMATGYNHTPGQSVSGDAVLVGRGSAALDADVGGKLWKVDSLEDLKTFDFKAKPKQKVPESAVSPAAAELPAETETESQEIIGRRDLQQALIAGEDELDAMNRVQLIQLAAKKWPGKERWTWLKDDALRAKIRELDHN